MNTFRQMLEDLGVSITRETERELETLCPFHDDRHPSFYVNKESGAWICHSGCGAGSFFDLYEKLHTLDLQPVRTRSETSPPIPVDMALADLIDRGFTPAMLERWEIAYNGDVGAIEIPCYAVDDHLVGYIFRMPEGVRPKYRHPEGFQKSLMLFGMHKLLPFKEKRKEVVLVEGPLDAIWLQEAGVPAVAILGSRLSAEQVSILYDLSVHTATLAFDNDAAGLMATALATEVLRKSAVWVWMVPLPSKYKDVQEIPLDAIPEIIARKHLCTNGRGLIPATSRRWLGHEIGYHDASTAWRY